MMIRSMLQESLRQVFRSNKIRATLLVLLASVFAIGVCVEAAQAFQGGNGGTEKKEEEKTPEGEIQDKTDELGNTFSRAFNGDSDAWMELAGQYLIPALIALIILVIGYMFAAFVGRVVGGQVTKRVDETLGKFFAKMIRILIFIMVVLGVLGYFGVDVTSFAAILAAAGFAVGMALQGTLSNFAAGIMILIFRPYKVGDVIDAAGSTGKVDEVDLFTTRLNTPDNRHLIVPNSAIFSGTIENVTMHDTRRVDVSVGVDYSADIQTVREVLLSAAKHIDGILDDPEPVAVLAELGDSSVNWSVRVWCNTGDFWAVKEALTEAVKYKLDGANIGIPYPTMDVNVSNT